MQWFLWGFSRFCSLEWHQYDFGDFGGFTRFGFYFQSSRVTVNCDRGTFPYFAPCLVGKLGSSFRRPRLSSDSQPRSSPLRHVSLWGSWPSYAHMHVSCFTTYSAAVLTCWFGESHKLGDVHVHVAKFYLWHLWAARYFVRLHLQNVPPHVKPRFRSPWGKKNMTGRDCRGCLARFVNRQKHWQSQSRCRCENRLATVKKNECN